MPHHERRELETVTLRAARGGWGGWLRVCLLGGWVGWGQAGRGCSGATGARLVLNPKRLVLVLRGAGGGGGGVWQQVMH